MAHNIKKLQFLQEDYFYLLHYCLYTSLHGITFSKVKEVIIFKLNKILQQDVSWGVLTETTFVFIVKRKVSMGFTM